MEHVSYMLDITLDLTMKHDGQLSRNFQAKMGIDFFLIRFIFGQLVYNYTSLDLWWIY